MNIFTLFYAFNYFTELLVYFTKELTITELNKRSMNFFIFFSSHERMADNYEIEEIH